MDGLLKHKEVEDQYQHRLLKRKEVKDPYRHHPLVSAILFIHNHFICF
jgi:hypothetical protein